MLNVSAIPMSAAGTSGGSLKSAIVAFRTSGLSRNFRTLGAEVYVEADKVKESKGVVNGEP